MAALLAWQNLIFIIPLFLGIIMVLGMALGFVDMDGPDIDIDIDVDVDVDVDVDMDMDVDHDLDLADAFDAKQGLMELFGLGRVPFSIILMCMMLLFGGLGIALKLFTALPFFLVWAGASVISLGGTAGISRVIMNHLPHMETYAGTTRDLIGMIGEADTRISPNYGMVDVHCGRGNLRRIECITEEGVELTRGERFVIYDYDEEHERYLVARFDKHTQ